MADRIVKLAALCTGAFVCVSCSNLFTDTGVKDYLKEYTENAAVVSYTLDSTYPTDNSGITCLPSGSSRTITLTLRNPQQYTLTAGYVLPAAASTEAAALVTAGETPISYTQDSDTAIITATISDDFITAMDKGGDISLTVTLTEPKSLRSFSTYTIPLHANTPPPAVTGAVVYVQGASGSQTYVLCFNLPETVQTKSSALHSDIASVSINGTAYSISTASDGTMSLDSSIPRDTSSFTDFTEGPKGIAFNAGGQPVYYPTGTAVTTDNTIYTITLTDSAGLSTSVQTSVYAEQLGAVTGTDLDSAKTAASPNYVTQNEDGTGTVTLSVPSATTSGTSYDTTDTHVVYRVYAYNSTTSAYDTLYSAGTSSGTSVSLSLPAGKSVIKTSAQKSLYVDSDETDFYCYVLRSRVFISADGSDSASGNAATPVATMSHAISLLDDKTASGNTIYVLSDLTNTGSGDFITLDDSTLNVTIMGSDTSRTAVQRTIDAARSSSATGRVMTITAASSVTLQNLTLTGGYTDNGGGIYLAGGSLILTDTVIGSSSASSAATSSSYSNCATASGGGLYLAGGTATLDAGSYISYNYAGSAGGGVYQAGGTVAMNTGSYISYNSASGNGGGIYMGSDTNCTVSGGSIYSNTAAAGNGIYDTSTLTISGSAVVNTDNDVYLDTANSKTIYVGTLTASGTVACITPASYTVGTQLLTDSSSSLTQSVCNKFTVTASGGTAYAVSCSSGSSGVLAKSGATSGITIGSYTFTAVDSSGTSASSYTASDTVYWTISSGSTVICSNSVSSSSVTSTTTALYSNGTAVSTSTRTDGYTGSASLSGMPAGSYRLYVKAVISGYTYDGYIDITVTE